MITDRVMTSHQFYKMALQIFLATSHI